MIGGLDDRVGLVELVGPDRAIPLVGNGDQPGQLTVTDQRARLLVRGAALVRVVAVS